MELEVHQVAVGVFQFFVQFSQFKAHVSLLLRACPALISGASISSFSCFYHVKDFLSAFLGLELSLNFHHNCYIAAIFIKAFEFLRSQKNH